MVTYSGTINELITNEDLLTQLSIDTSSLCFNGDIEFMKFFEDGKLYLIPSKPLRINISRNNLNPVASGLNVAIGDYTFNVSLMTGNTGSTTQWSKFIVDNSDELKNVIDVKTYTWCKDINTNVTNYTAYIVRGYGGDLTKYNYFSAGTSNGTIGFRPILTLNKSFPSLNIENQDLGKVTTCINPITYTVDNSGYSFNITEKLDGEVLSNIVNQPSGSTFTLDLSEKWESLPYGKHQLEIIATEIFDVPSTTVITFEKVPIIPSVLPDNSTLNKTISYFSELNEVLKYQCVRLKEVLAEKRVNTTNTSKLSDLISKVSNINKFVPGDKYLLIRDTLKEGELLYLNNTSTVTYSPLANITSMFDGGLRYTATTDGSNSGYIYHYMYYKVISPQGEEKSFETLGLKASTANVLEINDICVGDFVEIGYRSGSSGTTKLKEYHVKYDVVG